jgi:hypothetical protein
VTNNNVFFMRAKARVQIEKREFHQRLRQSLTPPRTSGVMIPA